MHARNRNQIVRLQTMTFYGQLLRILCLTIPATPDLNLSHSEILVLAEIQPCKIFSRHSSLDIQYYKDYGTPLIFDITCIQCLVGRIKLDGGRWAIIDRSGTLAQAYYAGEGQEINTN